MEHSGRVLQHSELVLELSGASQNRSASFLAQQKSRARTTSNSRAQHDNRARKKHTNRARARDVPPLGARAGLASGLS